MNRIKDDESVPIYNIDQVLGVTAGVATSLVRINNNKLVISKAGESITDYNTLSNIQDSNYSSGTALFDRNDITVTSGSTSDIIYLEQYTLKHTASGGFNALRGGYNRVFNQGSGSGQWVIGHRGEITDEGSGNVTTGFYATSSSLNVIGSGGGTITLANAHNVYSNYANLNKTVTTALGMSVKAEGAGPIGSFTLLNLDSNVQGVTGNYAVIGVTNRTTPSQAKFINSLMDRESYFAGFLKMDKTPAEIDAEADGTTLATVDWVNANAGGASYTASNGITLTGNNFTFGGTLTGPTTLTHSTSNPLVFSNTGSTITFGRGSINIDSLMYYTNTVMGNNTSTNTVYLTRQGSVFGTGGGTVSNVGGALTLRNNTGTYDSSVVANPNMTDYVLSTLPKTSGTLANDYLTTVGDILYYDSISGSTRLGIGAQDQVLTVSASGVPVWADASSGGGGTPTLQAIFDESLSGADVIATINTDKEFKFSSNNGLTVRDNDSSFSAYSILSWNAISSVYRNSSDSAHHQFVIAGGEIDLVATHNAFGIKRGFRTAGGDNLYATTEEKGNFGVGTRFWFGRYNSIPDNFMLNYLLPRPTLTANTDRTMPIGFTDGSSTAYSNASGIVDLSTLSLGGGGGSLDGYEVFSGSTGTDDIVINIGDTDNTHLNIDTNPFGGFNFQNFNTGHSLYYNPNDSNGFFGLLNGNTFSNAISIGLGPTSPQQYVNLNARNVALGDIDFFEEGVTLSIRAANGTSAGNPASTEVLFQNYTTAMIDAAPVKSAVTKEWVIAYVASQLP